MQFHFDDEQEAFRDAVRRFCQDRFDLEAVAAREHQPADPAAWRGLAELGLLGMFGPEDCAGVVEAAIAFEVLGAHLASGPLVWSTIAAPFVDGVADGEVRVTGVVPEAHPAGPLVIDHVDEADVVVVLHPDRVEVLDRADLQVRPSGELLDPLTPMGLVDELPAGRAIGGAAEADRLRLLGAALHAASLVGGAQGVLDVARAYALERHQFGVPIGSFQAVKHMLADMFVRLELARSETWAAAATLADPTAGDPERAVSGAKVLAADAAITNSRVAVQVLGGMGFTWDMLPHYFLKRAWVLEMGFGAASQHAARLGAAVGNDVAVAAS